nr:MAG TPA: RNA-dependent RNA polymerase [Caudoviricetes sp.]
MYDDILMHYGTPRHSGRYPWGSGENPYQSESGGILSEVARLKSQGMTESEIAKTLGMSTKQLRAKKSIANAEKMAYESQQCLKLKDKGYSTSEIGRIMGIPESTVRNRLNPVIKERASKTENVASYLKDQVDSKKYLDVGVGVERQLNISKERLDTAVALLEEKGYKKQYIKVEQASNPNQKTTVMVLTKGDVPWKEVFDNRDKIISPHGVYFEDNGKTMKNLQPPKSIDSNRISVCYAEDGGVKKDGVIELRPGVSDISLGNSNYAQVRIAVDGTHYLKGMAMYSNDLPDGIDIRFNTNKHKGTPMLGPKDNTVLKPLKSDPDNPFGATVRQRNYINKDGKEELSLINIVNDDSDWGKWSKTLSSQFLSKQSPALAKRQLDLTYKQMDQEFHDICKLTNPALKKVLLETFSENCDSAAVHLKAAGMPRQQTHVILPLTEIKDTEVYAPNYKTGEQVALIRYPHGGIFEIPILTVNNNNKQGKELLGSARNAIGINSNVAERLSGADFDGDTVTVIPTTGQNIKASRPLEDLKNFDPKERYRAYPGMPEVSEKTGFYKQREMGKVSNLITDMTIKGAPPNEIARAVRHSMVVIDAEKHNLDWRSSYVDNGIAQLKAKYQGGVNKGASTLISKASSEYRVPVRSDRVKINPVTGEKIFTETGETYSKVRKLKNGEERISELPRTEMSTKMAETKDAYILSSGTRMESIYAEHANKLKALGNSARLELINTPSPKINYSAKKTYSAEVESLKRKLNISLMNAPAERQAQLIANSYIQSVIRNNPDIKNDKEGMKKLRTQAISAARARTGTTSRTERNIEITPREWEAIQAGAISQSVQLQILKNTDQDKLREMATPRNNTGLSPSQKARAKALINAGYTQAEAAEAVGVSASTLNKWL